MKLAEALLLRADRVRTLEQLKARAQASARYQEGEEPPEDAEALLRHGPPFDPEELGLHRHAAYVTANEVVFVSIFTFVPAIFVLNNRLLMLVGVALAVLGSYLIYYGTRLKTKSPESK